MYWLTKQINKVTNRVDKFGNQYFLFGIFGTINYPIFYIIWVYFSSQTYENLTLRVIATLLCVPLIFHQYWPKLIIKWQALYWYVALTFCLPFFFTYMLLKNNATDVWLMSTTIVMVWLMLLVDSLSFIILIIIGTGSAILLFHFTSVAPFYKENIQGLMYQYFGSLAVVLIFARQKNRLHERTLRMKTEASSKAKSEFIANMSHDLRTPLTGMTGMIYGILDSTEKMTKAVNKVDNHINRDEINRLSKTIKSDTLCLQDATDQLLKLCSEILEISKLESNNLANKKMQFDLKKSINEAILLLKPVAIDKNIQLKCNMDSDIPTFVEGMPTYFHRSLINIISNALKFTSKGFVSINVTIDKTDPSIKTNNSIMLVLNVEDTGIGISHDKIDSIFDHFTKLNPSYNGTYKGTGLGLYTVKQYLRAMNGSISVKSNVGQGSVFQMRIPLQKSDKKCIGNEYEAKNTKPVKFSNLENTSSIDHIDSQANDAQLIPVLVVEDTLMAATAVKRFLNNLGCRVDIAKNGSEAVEKAYKDEYQLILMDIGLPDFSGIEAAKKIIALPEKNKSSVPIVALTGHGVDERVIKEAIACGIKEVATKPANKLILQHFLDTYVN